MDSANLLNERPVLTITIGALNGSIVSGCGRNGITDALLHVRAIAEPPTRKLDVPAFSADP